MLKNKKIVTLDWDIVMGPSIELYNNIAGSAPWDVLEENPQLALCQMHQETAQLMIHLVMKWVELMDIKNIHFVMTHEQVLDYVNDDDTYTLINIDHHHDLGYQNQFECLTCGNWVEFFHRKGTLKNYIWVKNRNSDITLSDDQKLKTTLMMDIDCADSYLWGTTPDILVICLSPEFVPTKYQSWVFFINSLIESIYKKRIKIEYPKDCGCKNKKEDELDD